MPDELRDAGTERALGEACLARGEWREALAAFGRAAGQSGHAGRRDRLADGRRPRGSRGLRRGARDLRPGRGRRVAARRRGTPEGVDRFGPRPSRRRRGERPGGGGGASRWRRPATMRGRSPRRTRRWARSTSSERPGPRRERTTRRPLAPRNGRATRSRSRGSGTRAGRLSGARPVGAALEILDEAVRHADTVGFSAFHARALVNRGRAKQGIGRFEEAMADFTAARDLRADRLAVRRPALTREGSMHALRGDAFLARAAFESAIRAAGDANDSQALAPALIGPGPAIVFDDPIRGERSPTRRWIWSRRRAGDDPPRCGAGSPRPRRSRAGRPVCDRARSTSPGRGATTRVWRRASSSRH